jgi:hypothetical protein
MRRMDVQGGLRHENWPSQSFCESCHAEKSTDAINVNQRRAGAYYCAYRYVATPCPPGASQPSGQ